MMVSGKTRSQVGHGPQQQALAGGIFAIAKSIGFHIDGQVDPFQESATVIRPQSDRRPQRGRLACVSLVVLTLCNSYSKAVKVRDLACKIALAGDFLAKGALPGSTVVPALALVSVGLPVTIESGRFSESDFDALFQPEIPYRLRGSAELEAPVHVPRIELDASGAIQMPERIQVTFAGASAGTLLSVKGARLRRSTTAGLDGSLAIQVRNPFVFPIVVQRFQYQVATRGEVIGDGLAESMAALESPKVTLAASLVIRRRERELYIDIQYGSALFRLSSPGA